MLINQENEEVESRDDGGFTDLIMGMHQWHIEAMIYMARSQGLRAGVRPNTIPPEPSDEKYPPVKRAAFIEFSEKTKEWGFRETPHNTAWLDSLPQYEQ